MKKIFVTGGRGFIASHVIEALKLKNYDVVTNVRSFTFNRDENFNSDYLDGVEGYLIDNRDKVGMRSIIEKVDGVINLAGILGTKSIDKSKIFYENNVKSAINIFEACLEFDTPIVQISVGNYFETNDYSNSKYLAERELIKFANFRGLRGNVVRGLNAFGPRQKYVNTGKVIPTFIMQAIKNKDIYVYGGIEDCGLMDMIYVKDLANILIDVLEKTAHDSLVEHDPLIGYGRVFEGGTGIAKNVYDIAKLVIELTKSKSKIIELPMRDGESKRSIVMANNPYKLSGGFTNFTNALNMTIDYYKSIIE